MVTDFKKKQKGNPVKKIFLVLGLVVVFGVCGVLVFANMRMRQKKQELNTQIQALENKIQDIKSKNDKLTEGIAKSGDSQYIEKVAREELDLQKPGEKVYSFIMPESPEETAKEKKENFLQSWLGWLGKKVKMKK